MRASELEVRVLQILDQVRAGSRIEDSRVELKSIWPPPEKAARRLAAHANASGGEAFLWVIGVDEERGVVGANDTELANWISAVHGQFDRLWPDLERDLVILCDEGSVVALLFNSDRAPYLVKNPAFGTPEGGPVSLELPWREGTAVRSARRDDVLRILVPVAANPEIEVLGAELSIDRDQDRSSTASLTIDLYVAPGGVAQLTIPFHRISGTVRCLEGGVTKDITSVRIRPPTRWVGTGNLENASMTMNATSDELLVMGPGRAYLTASLDISENDDCFLPEAEVVVHVEPVETGMPFAISATLVRTGAERLRGQWSCGNRAADRPLGRPILLRDQAFTGAPDYVKIKRDEFDAVNADQRFVHPDERTQYERRGYFAPQVEPSPGEPEREVTAPAGDRQMPGAVVWMVKLG